MTEHKWLKLAGFLSSCTYGLQHADCPFKKFRDLDQYQRLELLIKMQDAEAEALINGCNKQKISCTPLVFSQQRESWSMAVAI